MAKRCLVSPRCLSPSVLALQRPSSGPPPPHLAMVISLMPGLRTTWAQIRRVPYILDPSPSLLPMWGLCGNHRLLGPACTKAMHFSVADVIKVILSRTVSGKPCGQASYPEPGKLQRWFRKNKGLGKDPLPPSIPFPLFLFSQPFSLLLFSLFLSSLRLFCLLLFFYLFFLGPHFSRFFLATQ